MAGVLVAVWHLLRDVGNTGLHFFFPKMWENLFPKLKRKETKIPKGN